MAQEGVAKVKLHKQDKEGLIDAGGPATSIPEKKEDPDELSSEDFKKAADDAQVLLLYPEASLRSSPISLSLINP